MKRKSILRRRLWYVRQRNIARINVLLKLLAVFLILVFFIFLFFGCLLPWLKQKTEASISDTYSAALREAAVQVFSNGSEYKDIVNFESSEEGEVILVSLDASSLEGMTEEMLHLVEMKLGLPEAGKVRVTLAGQKGPVFQKGGILDFDINISQNSRTIVDYKSEYIPVNDGQTRMAVSLDATAEIDYNGTFLEGSTKVSLVVPVGEYIILGRLPSEQNPD